MNNQPTVNNRPIGCTFCGASVPGRVTSHTDNKTKTVYNECRWVCSRCGNLVKAGKVE